MTAIASAIDGSRDERIGTSRKGCALETEG
jgi:hypothetical protein